MKLFQWIAFVALALAQAPAPPGVLVQGRVTDTRNGDPLPSVQIRMTTTLPGEQSERTFTAFTGTDGRFSLRVPPANYYMLGMRPGFFGPTRFGTAQSRVQRSLNLTDGQAPPEQQFSLTPAGVVTGRIFDDAGRPAPALIVTLNKVSYDDARARLGQFGSAETNEQGEYRIYWAPPGDYLVTVESRDRYQRTTILTSGPEPQTMLMRTFYPGTLQIENARVVSVTSGAEVKSIDFGIKSARTFKISGRMLLPDVPPGAVSSATSGLPFFLLVNRDGALGQDLGMSSFDNPVSQRDRQAGFFEWRNVPAGRYDLFAYIRNQVNEMTSWGLVSLEVDTQDLNNIGIPVHPAIELRGQVTTRGTARIPEGGGLGIGAQGSARVGANATPDANGQFTLKGLAEGTYRVYVNNLFGFGPDPNLYVADMRFGDRSVMNDGLIRLTAGKQDVLELIVASGTAAVTGIGTYPEGKTPSNSMAVLVPDGPNRANLSFYRPAPIDESGRFMMRNLPPGRYKLFAWEGATQGAWTNAEFLAKYEDLGVVVTLASGPNPDIRVPVIWLQP